MVTLRCLVPVAVLGNQYIYQGETRSVSGATADLLLDEDPPRFAVVEDPQNLQEPAPEPTDGDDDGEGDSDETPPPVNLNEPGAPLPPRNERPVRQRH